MCTSTQNAIAATSSECTNAVPKSALVTGAGFRRIFMGGATGGCEAAGLHLSNFIRGVDVLAIEVDDRANA